MEINRGIAPSPEGPPPTSDEIMYEWSLLRKLYLTLRMRVVAKAKAKMSAPGLVKPVVVDQLVLLVSSNKTITES